MALNVVQLLGKRTLLPLLILLLGFACPQVSAKPLDLKSDEFPVVAYSVDNPGMMKFMQGSGIGYIQSYSVGTNSSPKGIAHCLKWMDDAHEHGFKVMFYLRGRKWVKEPNGLEEMLKIVKAVKDHPAMGFWYLCDEPTTENAPPSKLAPFYKALKRVAPDIPVALVNCWDKSWYKYRDVLDLQMVDLYPVRTVPFPKSNIRVMTNFVQAALKRGKPVMPVYQCFTWRTWASGRKTYFGKPVKDFRHPTQTELRYFCFSGLTLGVRATCWWSIYHGYRPDGKWKPGQWLKEEFIPVTKEFADFVKLIKPAHKPTKLTRASDEDFFMAVWKRPAGTYLVAINAMPLERECVRWMEGHVDNAKLVPLGATRKTTARIEDGKLVGLTFQPWETFVWEVEPEKKVVKKAETK